VFNRVMGRVGAAALVTVAVAAGPVAVAHADTHEANTCASQVAAYDGVVSDLKAHVATRDSVNRYSQTAVDNYNNRLHELKAQLETVSTKRASCEVAVKGLGGAPADMPTEFTSLSSALGTSPGKDAINTFVTGIGKLVGDSFKDERLQTKKMPAVGDKDLAVPGGQITAYSDGSPAISARAVVPIADVVQLSQFTALTPVNQWAVLMARKNYQWMSNQAVLSQSSASAQAVNGLDSDWTSMQQTLATETKQTLNASIDLLIKSQ